MVVSADKMLVGELEHIYVDPPGVNVVARIDTGATSSSLHAENVVPFERDGEDWVRFDMMISESDSVSMERRIIRHVRVVQQADPGGSRRPVVAMRVRLGEIQDTFEFTLADRSHLENEMILGRYTGHNFWALTGLDAAIDLCELAGRDDLVEKYRSLRDSYYDRFMARLREVSDDRGGRIPPGLDVVGGTDWGNLLAVYPGGLMDPFDPLVTSTFDYIRQERMAEGIAMWQQSMHHYITERVAQTALIRGEQERVLDDFYAMLLHTGSCHEGFEWGIFPWNGRDYCIGFPGSLTCNFPPHGWYAALMNTLFRNMLVREEGDMLHLCSALSPAWTRPGDKVVVERAPTWFGQVTFTLDVSESAAVLEFNPQGCARTMPARVVFHAPYYVRVKKARINGEDVSSPGPEIELPLSGGELRMEWERLPAEPRSYQHIVEWYKEEYRRRWTEGR